MPLTPQQAEDALRTSQAALETAANTLDKARSLARTDGPKPFGADSVPSVAAARAAYDTALAQRDADRTALADANAATRPFDSNASIVAAQSRPGGR